MTARRRGTILYIMGMDQTTTKEDVENAIQQTGVEAEDIEVKGIREGRYSEYTATVEIPREQAISLIRTGELKVGWLNCAVKERVTITICYKCL